MRLLAKRLHQNAKRIITDRYVPLRETTNTTRIHLLRLRKATFQHRAQEQGVYVSEELASRACAYWVKLMSQTKYRSASDSPTKKRPGAIAAPLAAAAKPKPPSATAPTSSTTPAWTAPKSPPNWGAANAPSAVTLPAPSTRCKPNANASQDRARARACMSQPPRQFAIC